MQLARILAFVATLGGFVAPAAAQIYQSREVDGTLVFSDRPGGSGGPPLSGSTVRAARALHAGAYHDLIEQHAASYQVRPDLVRAVIQVESGFNPRARSPKGAMGLMQLMPATARELGVRNPFDPAQNIRAGVAYLRQLLDRYDNDEELALAAYNAGPTAVQEHGNAVPPYRETRNYVSRIKGMTTVSAATGARVIYRTLDIVNGRPVPRYSDTRPSSGTYEVVTLGR